MRFGRGASWATCGATPRASDRPQEMLRRDPAPKVRVAEGATAWLLLTLHALLRFLTEGITSRHQA